VERHPDRKDQVLIPGDLAESFQPIIGHAVSLRPLMPEDQDIEHDFVSDLSPESRHGRLLGGLVRITPEYIAKLTKVDYSRDMAIAATVMSEEKETLIGVARYVRDADAPACEFAIVIADTWQDRGIGRRLMIKLIGVARARGLETIYGDVLSTNQRMLTFCRTLGFIPHRHPGDHTVTRVTLQLA
jgi:acetyltransferase